MLTTITNRYITGILQEQCYNYNGVIIPCVDSGCHYLGMLACSVLIVNILESMFAVSSAIKWTRWLGFIKKCMNKFLSVTNNGSC